MSQDFHTTRWTLVLDAARTDGDQSRPALEYLCRTYWKPLYAYARRSGKCHDDAQDSIQAFFEYLLKKNLAGRADPEVGRFRTFLLSSLRHFMLTEHRDATTQKRGGNVSLHIPFDESFENLAEFSDNETPAAAYERKWAHTLVNLALDRLAAEQTASGLGDRFRFLRTLLLDPSNAAAIHPRLNAAFGMTDGAIRTSLSRLRARFREIIRMEVARLVDDPAEIEDEILHLLKSFN